MTCLLAAQVAGQVGGPFGQGGLETVEVAIRAAVLALVGSRLGRLLATDTGYRGPRAACGAGHEAEFVVYRAKTLHAVLGPVRSGCGGPGTVAPRAGTGWPRGPAGRAVEGGQH